MEKEGWGSGERGRGMGEWRMRARDGGVENEGEGWGEWRKRARDGGSGE